MRLHTFVIGCLFIVSILAHCQVPCGIYDDKARLISMLEDTETIRKAVNEIEHIYADHQPLKPNDYNQIVRWVNTKEDHASNIIKTLTEYFILQVSFFSFFLPIKDFLTEIKRVNIGESEKLVDYHTAMKYSLLCKQTVEIKKVDQLAQQILKLGRKYYGLWEDKPDFISDVLL